MHRKFEKQVRLKENPAVLSDLDVLAESLNMEKTPTQTPIHPSQENPKSPLDSSTLTPSDQASLVDLITNGILSNLSNDAYLEKFLNTRELRRDNQVLAAQIKHLLKDNKRLEAELANQGNQLGSYKQIAGNIYLKIN